MGSDEETAMLRSAVQRTDEARSIVAKLGLVERWSKLGDAVLVGSISFGLALGRDIDLDVYADTLSVADSFRLMAGIAEDEDVVEITFRNRKGDRGKWLYWEIRYQKEDAPCWTIEIFYTCPGDPYFRWPQRFSKAMQRSLTDEHRLAILSIKEALAQDTNPSDCKSFDVYRAVLEGGVRTMGHFREWLQRNRTEGIVPWIPGE